MIVTDPASAETIKYAANAFLATKISFINAVAAVCEAVGADIKDVALGMGYDTRIGHEFLKPGPGWGGSCFPKDTRAMVRIAEDAGYDFDLLKGVVTVNDEQLDRVVDEDRRAGRRVGRRRAHRGVGPHVQGPHRRPPRVPVARRSSRGCAAKGAIVRGFDPSAPGPLEGLEVVDDPYAAVEGAEVLAVLTEWDEFRWLDFDKVAELDGAPARSSTPATCSTAPRSCRRGFDYRGIGRS